MIETLIPATPEGTRANFYRTAAGAEIDLLLTLPDRTLWAVEIKRSLQPKLERGFHHACSDLAPARRLLIYPGEGSYPLAEGVEVMPLPLAGEALLAAG